MPEDTQISQQLQSSQAQHLYLDSKDVNKQINYKLFQRNCVNALYKKEEEIVKQLKDLLFWNDPIINGVQVMNNQLQVEQIFLSKVAAKQYKRQLLQNHSSKDKLIARTKDYLNLLSKDYHQQLNQQRVFNYKLFLENFSNFLDLSQAEQSHIINNSQLEQPQHYQSQTTTSANKNYQIESIVLNDISSQRHTNIQDGTDIEVQQSDNGSMVQSQEHRKEQHQELNGNQIQSQETTAYSDDHQNYQMAINSMKNGTFQELKRYDQQQILPLEKRSGNSQIYRNLNQNISPSLQQQVNQGAQTIDIQIISKKVGKAQKPSSTESTEDAQKNTTTDSQVSQDKKAENNQKSSQVTQTQDSGIQTRKRGRPKKSSTQQQDNVATKTLDTQTSSRRRGRQQKQSTIQKKQEQAISSDREDLSIQAEGKGDRQQSPSIQTMDVPTVSKRKGRQPKQTTTKEQQQRQMKGDNEEDLNTYADHQDSKQQIAGTQSVDVPTSSIQKSPAKKQVTNKQAIDTLLENNDQESLNILADDTIAQQKAPSIETLDTQIKSSRKGRSKKSKTPQTQLEVADKSDVDSQKLQDKQLKEDKQKRKSKATAKQDKLEEQNIAEKLESENSKDSNSQSEKDLTKDVITLDQKVRTRKIETSNDRYFQLEDYKRQFMIDAIDLDQQQQGDQLIKGKKHLDRMFDMNQSYKVDKGLYESITIIDSPEKAQNLVNSLNSLYQFDKDYIQNKQLKYNIVNKQFEIQNNQQIIVSEWDQLVFAVDTETSDIDIKNSTPVGRAEVTSLQIYCGYNVAETIEGKVQKDMIFVDFLNDHSQQIKDILNQGFLGLEKFKKVYHNFSFDHHAMHASGLQSEGFYADTIHLARLNDTSLLSYSLESLTNNPQIMKLPKLVEGKIGMKELFAVKHIRKDGSEGKLDVMPAMEDIQIDKWIFYAAFDTKATWYLFYNLQHRLSALNLSEQKIVMPEVLDAEGKQVGGRYNLWGFYLEHLQKYGQCLCNLEEEGFYIDRDFLAGQEKVAEEQITIMNQEFREWVSIFSPQAKLMNISSTQQLIHLIFGGFDPKRHYEIDDYETDSQNKFSKRGRKSEKPVSIAQAKQFPTEKSLIDLLTYNSDWKKVSDSLNKDLDFEQTRSGEERIRTKFILSSLWMSDYCNRNQLDKETLNQIECKQNKGFEYERISEEEFTLDMFQTQSTNNVKDQNDPTQIFHPHLKPSEFTPKGQSQVSNQILKDLAGKEDMIQEEYSKLLQQDKLASEKKEPSVFVQKLQSAGNYIRDNVLKMPLQKYLDLKQEGKKRGLGPIYAAFGGGPEGVRACYQLSKLTQVWAVDKLLTSFIQPLQGSNLCGLNDQRIHPSLNINTETGRLSCRKPNLQNQPAMDKDVFSVRKAFRADPTVGDNTLIVADYGQLELRILAGMTNCKVMIDAFNSGGDFHSRTAYSMYDVCKEAVDSGKCAIDKPHAISIGQPDLPQIQQQFGTERKRAKIVNFSIAYGKSAQGFANDFGVSIEEAQGIVDKWYNERPEVLEWQNNQKQEAMDKGKVYTIIGRHRNIDKKSVKRIQKNGKEFYMGPGSRQAINTPIQGSAADIVMMAMLKINECEYLKQLGWRMLLQVHDEIILEGPRENSQRALEKIKFYMENPFGFPSKKHVNPFSIDLCVDIKIADTWADGK